MTIKQLTLLCCAAYYNPPREIEEALRGGWLTLGLLAKTLLTESEMGVPECGPIEGCGKQLLFELMEDARLSRMRVLAYQNNNMTTGFVAYAFEAPMEGVFAVFRGSESRGVCVRRDIDWKDNFAAPFQGSVQYEDIRRFVGRFRTGNLTMLGHSKGGHNALYALTVSKNERARCVAFNGQGFAFDQLSGGDIRRLQRCATHYVVEDDPVGVLLMHPEPRIFVKKTGEYHPHELCSFAFDEAGSPIAGKRPLWSYLLEGATTAYVNGHVEVQGGRVPGWLQCAFRTKNRLDAVLQG